MQLCLHAAAIHLSAPPIRRTHSAFQLWHRLFYTVFKTATHALVSYPSFHAPRFGYLDQVGQGRLFQHCLSHHTRAMRFQHGLSKLQAKSLKATPRGAAGPLHHGHLRHVGHLDAPCPPAMERGGRSKIISTMGIAFNSIMLGLKLHSMPDCTMSASITSMSRTQANASERNFCQCHHICRSQAPGQGGAIFPGIPVAFAA